MKLSDSGSQDFQRSGFTLVELLVVIGVISILISLLLPALNAARNAAKNVQCLSNERQLMLALKIYAENFRGYVPLDASSSAGVGGTWVEKLAPYLGERWNDRYKPAFSCPSSTFDLHDYADGHLPSSRYFSNYCGNAAYFIYYPGTSTALPPRLSSTRASDKTMLLMDGINGGGRMLWPNTLNSLTYRYQPFRHGNHRDPHKNHANIMFADGHAAGMIVDVGPWPEPVKDGVVPFCPWSGYPGVAFWDPTASASYLHSNGK